MFKLIDQTSDINGQQLYRLSKLYTLPDFVKKASSPDIYGHDEIQNYQYADPVHRQFPCHTGPATYISTLFFMDKRADMNKDDADFIASRLDDFAFFHGINEPIEQMQTKIAFEKVGIDNLNMLDDDIFALVLEPDESPSDERERLYPLRNALEVKKAAEWLKSYSHELPYHYRQKIASKIIEKANTYGAGLGDLDDFLQKQAGLGACSSLDAAQLLFDRARLLKRAGKTDYAISMGKMAKSVLVNEQTVYDPDSLIKLAELVDKVDKETGLYRFVDDLTPPEDIFFNITEKKASQLRHDHVSTVSGNIYKLSDLDNLKLADVRSLMGTDFADAISTGDLFVSSDKLSTIVPTLPLGDAELFDKLLASCGINPIVKEAAHDNYGLDEMDLKELAKLHTSSKLL